MVTCSACTTGIKTSFAKIADKVQIKNEKTKDACRSTIKVTAFVLTLLAVIVAVYASFGSFKMLPAQAPFRAIGTIGQYWSGAVTVISVGSLLVTTKAVLDLLTQKCSKKKEAAKVAQPTEKATPASKAVKAEGKKEKVAAATAQPASESAKPSERSWTNLLTFGLFG